MHEKNDSDCELVNLERWHVVLAFLEQVSHESLEFKKLISVARYLLSESRRIRAFVKKGMSCVIADMGAPNKVSRPI